jgi:O-antigen/teichoic acid export membrane protein
MNIGAISVHKIPIHLRLTFISVFARSIYVIISVYTIRIITGLVDLKEYALFAILMNTVTWLLLADIGIGNGLQNFISQQKIKKRNHYNYILVAVILLLIAFIFWVSIILLSNHFVTKYLFGKLDNSQFKNTEQIFLITCIIGLLAGIGTVSHKICNAFQKSYLPSIFTLGGSIVSLVGIFLLRYYELVNLTSISYVFFGGTIVFTIGPLVFFTIKAYKKANLLFVKKNLIYIARKILIRSTKFWIFSVASAFVLQIDYLVMSQTISSKDITLYNILFRLYGIMFMVYTLLLNTLWPSFAEWKHIGLNHKIKKVALFYVRVGIIATIVFSVALFFFTGQLVSLISKFTFLVPGNIIILLCIYFIIRIWSDTYAVILLSSNSFTALWIFTPLQAVIAIMFEFLLSRKFGLAGILYGLILSFCLTVVWGLPVAVNKTLKVQS